VGDGARAGQHVDARLEDLEQGRYVREPAV